MKIYVAAQYGRMEEARRVADALQQDGHTITSRWLDGFHEYNQEAADVDLADVDSSDLVLCITNPFGTQVTGGGRFFECGYAYGRGISVMLLGEVEMVFGHLEKVTVVPDLDSALLRLCLGDPASQQHAAACDPGE